MEEEIEYRKLVVRKEGNRGGKRGKESPGRLKVKILNIMREEGQEQE